MKNLILSLIFIFVIINALAFTNIELKMIDIGTTTRKSTTAAEKNELKKWEATPDGIFFKKWENSPAGIKVNVAASKIRKSVNSFSNMQATITSLTLPAGSRLGLGVMVNINGEEYILAFGPDIDHEFKQLRTLKVNDKITIKSHSISKAPKYAYAIVAGDYVERNRLVLYKRKLNKGGC